MVIVKGLCMADKAMQSKHLVQAALVSMEHATFHDFLRCLQAELNLLTASIIPCQCQVG